MRKIIKVTGNPLGSLSACAGPWLISLMLTALVLPVISTISHPAFAAEPPAEDKLSPEEILYEEAMEAARLQDFLEALTIWRKLAKSGDKQAQYRLGAMYRRGLGVKQDYKLAVEWFLKSAKNGYPRAQYNLGVMYQKGLGVDKNPATAEKWFKRASAVGFDLASNKLKGMLGSTLSSIDIVLLPSDVVFPVMNVLLDGGPPPLSGTGHRRHPLPIGRNLGRQSFCLPLCHLFRDL